ncbi:MAG: alpha-amylase family glycosyl hydrolase [Steroidobacteraceae bacterium]
MNASQHLHSQVAREWWRGAPIYQIYPYSFADSNGDGIGDLPGITQRLDHVASLGVAAIWLSPFFTSPMKDYGYDICDYRDVDPRFGTLEDFDRLVARAHELGLRVVIDQVFSHTSDRHPWFQESRANRDNPRADWYVWADPRTDGSPPCNWQSVFGGPAWTWDARRCQYYLHNFLAAQPALNVHSESVQDALLDSARFWLDRGVDGFRLDAINYAMHDPLLRDNPPAPVDGIARTRPCDYQLPLFNKSHAHIPQFIRRIRRLADSYGDRFTVAEVGGAGAEAEMHRFTSGSAHFHSAYGFNFLHADRLTPALVEHAVNAWPGDAGVGWPSWAFSNHDAPRAPSRWASNEDRAAMARMTMLLLACLRGNIFIYQGEELGLPQARIDFEQLRDSEAIANWPLTLGRDGARTPIPWSSVAPANASSWLPLVAEHLALAVDRQERDPDSQLAYTRRVLALRSGKEALLRGAFEVIEASAAILAFRRSTREQQLLCVFNLGLERREWQPAEHDSWRIIESSSSASRLGAIWSLPRLSGVVAEKGTSS